MRVFTKNRRTRNQSISRDVLGRGGSGRGPGVQAVNWVESARSPSFLGRQSAVPVSPGLLLGMLVPRWALTANGGLPGTGVWGWGLFRRLVSFYRKMGNMACLRLLP